MDCGKDRAHHFDPPNPERKYAAPSAATAESTTEPGAHDKTQKDQRLTKRLENHPGHDPIASLLGDQNTIEQNAYGANLAP